MKKIIIISIEPYTHYISNKFFYENDFFKNNYKFEYWCISDCNVLKNKFSFNDNREYKKYVKYFSKTKDLFTNIKNNINNDVSCIFHFPLNIKTYNIYLAVLNKTNKTYEIKYHENNFVFGYKKTQFKTRLKYLLRPRFLLNQIKYKIFQIYINNNRNFKSITCFYPAKVTENNQLSINSLDYNEFVKVKDTENLFDKPYFLFLDIYLSNHPDFNANNITKINGVSYFKLMNDFFDNIENNFNVDIVIAAHPKSDYKNEFKHRKCIKGKTALLTKYADLVFNHLSASLSYPCFFHKPIAYIYTDDFLVPNTYLNEMFERMKFQASYFNSPLINIAHEKLIEMNKIDENSYNNFIDDYLISVNNPKTNYEIISSVIEAKL